MKRSSGNVRANKLNSQKSKSSVNTAEIKQIKNPENMNFLQKFKHEPKKQLLYKKADTKETLKKDSPEKSPTEKTEVENKRKSDFDESKRKHIKIELETSSSSESQNKNLDSSRQWAPSHWSEVLINLKKMREKKDAPVDTMGCHKCIDETAEKKTQRFHSLVALMLSSQTKDQVTYAAMQRLNALPGKLTVSTILEISESNLAQLLHPVGFYKTKAKHIKLAVQILRKDYDDDIPKTVEDLCKLPGVGPKMAHICMQTAWDEVTGIGVDVHVHRISNRLGWVKKPTKNPEGTRNELQSWLPKEFWGEINEILVGFGQMTCLPVKPKCDECLNKNLCPVGRGEKKANDKK